MIECWKKTKSHRVVLSDICFDCLVRVPNEVHTLAFQFVSVSDGRDKQFSFLELASLEKEEELWRRLDIGQKVFDLLVVLTDSSVHILLWQSKGRYQLAQHPFMARKRESN